MMDKEDVVHTYSGILFSHEKGNLAICNSMDGQRLISFSIMLSNRERPIPLSSLTRGLKPDTQLTDSDNRLVVTRGRVGNGRNG